MNELQMRWLVHWMCVHGSMETSFNWPAGGLGVFGAGFKRIWSVSLSMRLLPSRKRNAAHIWRATVRLLSVWLNISCVKPLRQWPYANANRPYTYLHIRLVINNNNALSYLFFFFAYLFICLFIIFSGTALMVLLMSV